MITQQHVDEWLLLVSRWLSSIDKDDQAVCKAFRDALPHLVPLTLFLDSLEAKLTAMENVESILNSYKNIGQLLGRLCALDFLMVSSRVYKRLTKCLLAFCRKDTHSTIERKAREWATKQIRSTLTRKSELTQRRSSNNSVILNKVSEELMMFLQRPCRQWNNNMGCYEPVDTSIGIDERQIAHVCTVALMTAFVPSLHNVLEASISWISRLECNHKDKFFTDLQSLCTSGQVNLEYRTQTVVWLSWLPSLEESLLELVESCIFTQSQSVGVHDRIEESFIAKASAKHPAIFNMVSSVLNNLVTTIEPLQNDKLIAFCQTFHDCIEQPSNNLQLLRPSDSQSIKC